MTDLRFALRQLAKSPTFTLFAVLSLALGIGANATVIGWLDSVVLHPIPGAEDPQRLVVIARKHTSGAVADTVSYPDLQDLREATNLFSGVIASQFGSVSLGIQGEADWVWGQITTANFFDVLGVRAQIGRTFLTEEEAGGAGAPAAVISHRLWQQRFGGDPQVLGRTITVNRQAFTIVGVAPLGFRGTMGGLTFDLWVPLSQHRLAGFGDDDLTRRSDRWLHAQARLAPGVSIAQAQQGADSIMQRLAREYPNSNQDQGVALFSLWASPYGAQAVFLPLLRALLGVTILVFLLVVANVANLLLVKASARAREMAVRLAVGASRRRLLRQVLTESLVLAALGGGLGILFAIAAQGRFFRLLPSTYLPIGHTLRLGWLELGLVAALTLAAGLLFGWAPALAAGRADLQSTLKDGGRGDSGRSGKHRLRSGLVVTEIALALVLLVTAGLCLQSFERARRMDPGFQQDRVWLSGFRLRAHGLDDAEAGHYFAALRQQLAAAPGVESAAFADWLPLGYEGGSAAQVQVEGYQPSPGEHLGVGLAHVSPDYFRTLQIPLRDGRDFREADGPDTPGVIIVNEAFVQRFLPNRHPIGAKVRYWGQNVTIIGVVPTGHYRSLAEPPKPFLYASAWQAPSANLTAVIRTAGDPAAVSGLVRREAAALNASVKIWVEMPLADYTSATFAVQRVAAQLSIALGVVAIALAAMGIYGVMSFSVSQRTRELGIRLALGAPREDIQGLVLRYGLRLTALGLALGAILGWGATRMLGSLLIEIRANDPLTWLVVPILLAAIALAACWLPARRAARVDPLIALRSE